MEKQVVYFNGDGSDTLKKDRSVVFKKDVLQSILCRPEVKDKPVIVISEVGAMRRGKSYLLNYFLQYLRANGQSNWPDSKSIPGFISKKQTDRVTVGINFWSEVFALKLSSGVEVAVVIIDTQVKLVNSLATYNKRFLYSNLKIKNSFCI